ncbi:MAG: hypothetical protein COB40_04200 [Marinosulfonomonas sp.]|nr:MAG: hypothetical protein COB40_04200 [Marinosulfonomonas sp.]
MTSEVITDIAELELPYGRRATLKNVEFEGGMNMLRVTLREGRRFTIFDLDANSARDFGNQMSSWADKDS